MYLLLKVYIHSKVKEFTQVLLRQLMLIKLKLLKVMKTQILTFSYIKFKIFRKLKLKDKHFVSRLKALKKKKHGSEPLVNYFLILGKIMVKNSKPNIFIDEE